MKTVSQIIGALWSLHLKPWNLSDESDFCIEKMKICLKRGRRENKKREGTFYLKGISYGGTVFLKISSSWRKVSLDPFRRHSSCFCKKEAEKRNNGNNERKQRGFRQQASHNEQLSLIPWGHSSCREIVTKSSAFTVHEEESKKLFGWVNGHCASFKTSIWTSRTHGKQVGLATYNCNPRIAGAKASGSLELTSQPISPFGKWQVL